LKVLQQIHQADGLLAYVTFNGPVEAHDREEGGQDEPGCNTTGRPD
jgi:hypothetical protein